MQQVFGLRALPKKLEVYEGTIREVDWDRDAWTLLVDMPGSGRRLLQVPKYAGTPGKGDRIRLIGRQPLLGVQINDQDVVVG